MRFCEEHWRILRESVEKYGLDQLVANSGEEVAGHLIRDSEGEATAVDFEPLMGAHNMLLRISSNYVGAQIMFQKPDGSHRCPVCELMAYNWAEGAAWQARLEAERRGLVPADRSDLDPSVLEPAYLREKEEKNGS